MLENKQESIKKEKYWQCPHCLTISSLESIRCTCCDKPDEYRKELISEEEILYYEALEEKAERIKKLFMELGLGNIKYENSEKISTELENIMNSFGWFSDPFSDGAKELVSAGSYDDEIK